MLGNHRDSGINRLCDLNHIISDLALVDEPEELPKQHGSVVVAVVFVAWSLRHQRSSYLATPSEARWLAATSILIACDARSTPQ